MHVLRERPRDHILGAQKRKNEPQRREGRKGFLFFSDQGQSSQSFASASN